MKPRFAQELVLIFCLVTLFAAGEKVRAEVKAAPGERVITMEDFLSHAIANNPDIFAALTKIKESEALERQARAVYDIVFNLHYNRLYDQPFSHYSTVKMREQTTDNVGTRLQGVVPYLGTRLSGGVDFYRNNLDVGLPSSTPPFASQPMKVRYYNPELFVEVQQPLLRNWLGIVDEFPIRQARLNRLIIKETVDESIETIVSDLYNLYFSWYILHAQYGIYSRNVANSELLLRQIGERFRAGLSDRSDVSKARIQNLEYMKARELAGAKLQPVQKKVYKWYSGSGETRNMGAIVPEQNLKLPAVSPEGFPIDRTRQMRILRLSREVLGYQLKKEENERLPDLNLTLSYKRKSYTYSPDKSFTDMNYQNYTAGVAFTYPIGNDLGHGKVEEVAARIRRWDGEVRSFERNYLQSFEELKKIVAMYERILEYDRSLVEQARIQVREEERKYLQGRSDLFFVLDCRNSLLRYELVRLRDYVDAGTYQVQMLALMDELKK